MGSTIERLPFDLLDALNHTCAPVTVEAAPCQEVVIRPPFDLRRLIPAPTHTLRDAGPYITMGLVRARDPETGASDVTIHRLCMQGPDTLSIYFVPGRHIDQFRAKAERLGRPFRFPSASAWTPPSTWPPASSRPPCRWASTS